MAMTVGGGVILSRKAYVQKEFGEGAWNRVLETLPEEDRETLGGLILSVTWYPFDLNERLDKAIVEVLGKGEERIFEDIGAHSAKEALADRHAHLLTPGDPAKFLEKTDRVYSFYYGTGRREYEATGPTSGVMTTYDAETFSKTDCRTVIGWYKEALKQCGARVVTMTEEQCRAEGAEYCRYRIRWAM